MQVQEKSRKERKNAGVRIIAAKGSGGPRPGSRSQRALKETRFDALDLPPLVVVPKFHPI